MFHVCIQDFVSGSTFKSLKSPLHPDSKKEVEQIEKSITLLGFIRDWRIEGKLLPQYWRSKQRLKKKTNTFGTVTKGITYVHMVISIEETEKGEEIFEKMTDFTPFLMAEIKPQIQEIQRSPV